MPAFGATRDSPEHRGHVEEINQAKRDLGKPEPARLVGRPCADNQPRRRRLHRSQGENPTEVQIQAAINQRPFETSQCGRVIRIDRVPSVRMPDRPVHDRLTIIHFNYPEVRREIGTVRNDVTDARMLPPRKNHITAHILDPPNGPIEGFARIPTSPTETHLSNPGPHLVGRSVDRGRSGPLNLRAKHHIIARQRPAELAPCHSRPSREAMNGDASGEGETEPDGRTNSHGVRTTIPIATNHRHCITDPSLAAHTAGYAWLACFRVVYYREHRGELRDTIRPAVDD